jgi:Domain of unknown function (DUF4263)
VVILDKLGPLVARGRTGGLELLPKVAVLSGGRPDEALARWQWQVQNDGGALTQSYRTLHALYLELALLLASRDTTEADLQRVLLTSSSALDAYGTGLRAEVRLGNQYRVDLLMSYAGSDTRLLFIELEHARHRLFTRSGRFRAAITHAIQQVEDWFRWWRENPSKVPKGLDASLPLEGMVVAGRSAALSGDERKRLIHLNRGAKVKVITYDDLLTRIDQLLSLM